MRYLFSGEQGNGRDTIGILVAFSYSHLLEEIHLFLAGEEDDFGVTEHHDGVGQLVAKQPRLRKKKKKKGRGRGNPSTNLNMDSLEKLIFFFLEGIGEEGVNSCIWWRFTVLELNNNFLL